MKRVAFIAVAWLMVLALAPSACPQNITTFAGGGNTFSGVATSLPAGTPYKVSQEDSAGNYYVASSDTNRIVRINAAGEMSPFAGNGTSGYSGDGGPAVNASLALGAGGSTTIGLALDSAGNVYFADGGNEVVRVVNTQSNAITINGVTIQPGNIQTVAGHPCTGSCELGDGGPATSAVFDSPSGVAVDAAGNIYITDSGDLLVRVVNTQASSITIFNVTIGRGDIKTIAGNTDSCTPFSANGAQATTVCIGIANGLAIDSSGNLYIAAELARILEVIRTTGAIDSVVGTGSVGYSGDGGAATSAKIGEFPGDIAFDSAGNLFIADSENNVIREVTRSTGKISTVAGVDDSGTGVAGYNGDGIAATTAELSDPRGVAVDSSDNIFIADTLNHRIREVTNSNGQINTVVGNGWIDYNGDGVLATNTDLFYPNGVAVDGSGNLYLSDSNNAIRMVAAGATPTITTVAGNGIQGYSGDGGAATSASICGPAGVAVGGPSNSVFFADSYNDVIREVTGGIISTFAGYSFPALGCAGFAFGSLSRTPVAASSAYLYFPVGVAVDSSGDVFIADTQHNAVLEVTAGIAYDFAGTGTEGYSGDGGVATSAELCGPWGLALDGKGNLLIADACNNRIREVNLTSQIINTVAGNGTAGYNGEGAATSAELQFPEGVAVDSGGNIFIADTENNRIRKVTAGVISTVAGDGNYGYNGDGIPATSASLAYPAGVALDSLGNLYIADYFNSRIREVPALQGTSTSVASTQNPSTYGESVTFSATVAVTAGSGTPTGSVIFYDAAASATCAFPGDSLQIGETQTLSGGTASVSTTMLTVAVHNILACYSPTGNFVASSGTLSPAQTVNMADQATLTVTGPLSVTYGTTEPATASGGNGTGALSFSAGSSTGCSITGTNTINVTNASGTCSITATMAADSNYKSETSAPFAVTLLKANQTAVTVTGPASVTYGTPQTATASGGSGTGALTFSAGSSTGCSVAGANTVNVTNASGTCSITATMAADSNYNSASSTPFAVTLGKANQAAVTVTGPANVTYGTPQTATASGGSGTGALTFSAGSSTGCSITGANTVNVTNASGTCSITATMAADSNYNSASSTPFAVTLGKVAVSITPDGGKVKTFGTVFTTFTGVVSGLVSPDAVTVTYSSAGTASNAPPGPYNIIVSTVNFTTGNAANYSITENAAVNGLTVIAAPATQIVFTSAPFTSTAGQCSSAITVTSEDSFGNPSNVSATTPIALTSTSSAGTFYSDSACSAPLSGESVAAGSSSVTFYYEDTAAGTPSITAGTNLGSPTQQETINPAPASQLGITTTAFAILAGQCSGAVTVTSQDPFTNASNVTGTTQVNLGTASAGGTFYTDSVCQNQIVPSGGQTFVTIPSGSSSASFYYSDSVANTPANQTTAITVTDNNSGAGSLGTTNQPETILHLAFTTSSFVVAEGQCSGPITLASLGFNNNPAADTLAATLELTSTSAGGKFYSDTACSNPITPFGSPLASGLTISAGGNSVAFSYMDTSAGAPTLTASIGSVSLTQQETTGNAPSIISANSTMFTVNAAGTFSVQTTGSPAPALSEMGGLPFGVTFVDNHNGSATISGVPALGTVSTYSITISATNGLSPAASQIFTLTVQKANQSALTVVAPGSVTYGKTGMATASGGSGTGALTFSTAGSTGCAITGTNTVNVTNASGTCTITATVAADSNYNSTTSAPFPVTLLKATPTITFGPAPTATYPGSFTVSATTNSDGPLSYSVVTGQCTLATGATFNATAAGSCTVQASTPVTSNFLAGANEQIVTINSAAKITPTITWSTPAAITYGIPLSSNQLDATASVGGTFAYSPAAGTKLSAGARVLTVTFTPSNSSAYTTATAHVTIQVNQAKPVVVWISIPIIYGTPLGALQLDALVFAPNSFTEVPGTIVYAPVAGTILGAGEHQLSMTFTPNDTVDYTSASGQAILFVGKAIPKIAWAQPAPIVAGTPLSATQLNATANVPGTFAYTPSKGTVLAAGTHQLQVTFTPTDSSDYGNAQAEVALTVKSH